MPDTHPDLSKVEDALKKLTDLSGPYEWLSDDCAILEDSVTKANVTFGPENQTYVFPVPLGEPVQVKHIMKGSNIVTGTVIQFSVDESGTYMCVRVDPEFELDDEWYPTSKWGVLVCQK